MLAGRGALLWRIADLHHRHLDFEGVTRALAERMGSSAFEAGQKLNWPDAVRQLTA